jgi:multisubunit Na+/H+ antiporter MnhG subunit
MSLIHNERKRLLANALDRASTACFTVGIATPVAGYLYNVGNIGETISAVRLGLGLFGWLLAAVTLHLLARRPLKGLIS